MKPSNVLFFLSVLLYTAAQNYVGPEDSRLTTAMILDVPSTGISNTPSGRLFVLNARVDGSSGPQVVEFNQTDNTTTPYPDERWNSYTTGDDPANYLVRINSQRVGPDGSLWLVDVGSPSFGAPVILPDGPKLI